MMFRTYKDTFRTGLPDRVNKNTDVKYYCEFCETDSIDRIWDSEPDLEIHRRNVHKKELVHLVGDRNGSTCTVCLHKQADKEALIAHIKTHHLLSPPDATHVKRELFICDYCNKIFFNKQLLSVHISAFHLLTPEEKKRVKTICPLCQNKVAVKSVWFHFLHHGIIHTASCPICIKTFDNTKEVLKHIETHPGYYNCAICLYETKKESLFINHVKKHKRVADLKGRSEVYKITHYFVPRFKNFEWSGKFLNIFKGLKVDPHIRVCVLCRAMCMSNEEMLHHIYGDHSPTNVTEVKRYMCECGEEFFNNILLKHHIFTLKGDHKAFNGTKEELDKLIEEKNADWSIYNINNEPGPLYIDMNVLDTNQENNTSNDQFVQDSTDNDKIDRNYTPSNDATEVIYKSSNDTIVMNKSNNDTHMNNESSNDSIGITERSHNDTHMTYETSNNTNVIAFKSSNDRMDSNVKVINTHMDYETTNHTNVITLNDKTTNESQDLNYNQSNDITMNYETNNDTPHIVFKPVNDRHRVICESANDVSIASQSEILTFDTGNEKIHEGHNNNQYIQNTMIQSEQNVTAEKFDTSKGYYEQMIITNDEEAHIADGMQSSGQIQKPQQQFLFKVVVAEDSAADNSSD